MDKATTIFICILLNYPSFSQVISTEKVYEEQNLKIRIWKERSNSINHIDLSNLDDNVLIKSFEFIEPSLCRIADAHFGERRVIAMVGGREYFLIDIDSFESTKAIRPVGREELEDAQHGRLAGMRIVNGGKYLTFRIASTIYWMDISIPTEPVEMLVIELENAWVRDEPSNGEVIMKLSFGTYCHVLARDKQQTIKGKTDYWYKIRFNGIEGYIFGSQTSINQKN